MIRKVSRRGFLKGLAAGGLLLGLDLTPGVVRAALAEGGHSKFDPSVWVAIAPDNTVRIIVARSEMGQGIRSTLATVIADEMEADLAHVSVVAADGNEQLYGDQNTDGSRSLRENLDYMRHIGAAARHMLEAAAGKRWGAFARDVVAHNHEVIHLPTGRKLTYGELAAVAWKMPVPAPIRLKSEQELRYIGKEGLKGFDLADMTRGKAHYGIDVVLPGMLFAAVARPPVVGGTVAHVDEKEALATHGVKRTVRLPDGHMSSGFKPLGGVAVVATNTWAAIQGRNKLKIRWNDGGNASYNSAAYRKELEKTVQAPCEVVQQHGDVEQAVRDAKSLVRATYYVPHLVHAPMEPLVATAHVQGNRCEIWACTQNPAAIADEVAGALGIPKDHVTVHVTLLGGGFGRKSKADFAVEAALVSKAVGAPVKLQWTREDEIQHSYYHTVSAQHLEASLDEAGRVTGWLHRTAFPSIVSTFLPGIRYASKEELGMGVTDLPFNIPNVRIENGEAMAHVRIGWFRSVCNIQHAFAVNAFTHELAAVAGRDHKELLMELLADNRRFDPPGWNYGAESGQHPVDTARFRRVIEVVTDKAGWGRPMRPGHGLGLAVHRSFLTYVAVVVETWIDAEGVVHVPQIHLAVDCGQVVNPDRVRAQMEGSAIMSLSSALYGQVTFEHGAAMQHNFDDYQVVRMYEAPRQIHVHLVPNGGPPGGVGEPGVPPVAPALANAIHAAVGKRIRSLPIAAQLAVKS